MFQNISNGNCFTQNLYAVIDLVELWPHDDQPYSSSRRVRLDVMANQHLYVYPGGTLLADYPLGRRVAGLPGWTWNDLFRAVHDLIGHAATGFEFGPVGEENAFRFHACLYSPAALPALAAETRLQNCWTNFGRHRRNLNEQLISPTEPGFVRARERAYAPQKAFVPGQETIDYDLWRSRTRDIEPNWEGEMSAS
jgi:hypothetical protein